MTSSMEGAYGYQMRASGKMAWCIAAQLSRKISNIDEGEWKGGKRNDRGTLKETNGNLYEGFWTASNANQCSRVMRMDSCGVLNDGERSEREEDDVLANQSQ